MSNEQHLKTTEVLKLCRLCVRNPLNSGDSKSCLKVGNGYCELAERADSALSTFKYWLVDISTSQMHKEVKSHFAEQKADEEKRLEPVEKAYKRDFKKVQKIENQLSQNHSDFQDYENPIFGFQPIGN